MTTEKEKGQRAGKECLQSPKDVPCSICLDAVETAGGDRSVARLKCGHQFHLDCIGSAFNAKGAMECPNCRQVEGGQWLFSSGSYLQQQLLRNSTSDEDHTSAGMLYNLYSFDEHSSHASRRLPFVAHRQISIEDEHPSATSRWRSDIPPWIGSVNEIARLPSTDGIYLQSSQTFNMPRPSLHGSVLPNSQMLDAQIPRRRLDDDYLLYRHDSAIEHRYATNRGVGERNREERELAFGVLALSSAAIVEPPIAASRLGGVAHNTRRLGPFTQTPSLHEWGNNHESVRRHFANPFSSEVQHLHPLNRAASSHSYYDGHYLGARVPWL